MSRIISVSRRTDIPAFYGEWFVRRVQEGFAGVVAPYGGKRYLVSLAPQDVDCFVFWSKDFTPFVPHLDTLDRLGYRFYFNYTLTALPAVFETNVDKAAALKTLQYLGERYSPRHLNWRFDPIILSNITDAEFYLNHFERLAAQLAGRVERCYFSFVTEYEKAKRNLLPLQADQGIRLLQPHREEKIALADRLAASADRYGIRMYSCCGDYLLGPRIHKGHCIDGTIIEQLFFPQGFAHKTKPTRKECGCTESIDIGTYDTCPHGCLYCYANANKAVAGEAFRRHDPNSAFLGFDKPQSDSWVAELRQADTNEQANSSTLF
ncbi:MAG: DUF1848 domain-containing protein [Planctomycetes bacterium]|nr:DUF1848 domain-containing protein [Planctomycetota bacterium]